MLNAMTAIIQKVANNMLIYYEEGKKDIKYKGEIDLVTQYDVMIENELTEAFSKSFPDFKVIGEESFSGEVPKDGNIIYLDPIDGTTSFVHHFPFTCISAGAWIDGEPYCGCVAAPVLNEVYTAKKGHGAYLNGEHIYVSKTDELVKSLFATGFPYNRKRRQDVMPLFAHMIDICQGIRRGGSAALDLCYTARGSFDFYYEYELKPWDIAAGVLIVQEAGGVVTNANGEKLDITSGTLLAANPGLHSKCVEVIKSFVI